MKKIIFFVFIVLAAISQSCSTNDTELTPEADYFNFVYNNQAKNITSMEAIKVDNLIEVSGTTADGIGIDFKFNIYGDLYESFTFPFSAVSTINLQSSANYYSEHTFTFQLVELNTEDKTVKVNFSGKLYDDDFDQASSFSTVSGSFKVTYRNETPLVSGLGTFAKINGQDWHGASKGSSSSSLENSTALNIQNDGPYVLGIVYPWFSPVTGTYTFTSNNFNKRISFSKYDVATDELVDYNVNGTVVYTAANVNYVQGTFNLVATHPTNGSTITITNGVFKEYSVD